MNTQIVPVSDLEKMATAVAKSGLFGIKTPEQAMALMLIAQAEGLHPAIAARDYHVIQGRPSLKADAMMARFQAAGGKVKWTEYTEKRVAGIFSHPAGGEIEIDWTIDKAKTLGFLSKDNWKNYPRAMLRARCISEGIRTVFPGVVVGVYTPEEVEDFEQRPVKDMGTAEIVTTGMSESQRADFESAIDALGDRAGGEKLWADIVKVCSDAKDKNAYDTLKAKITAKMESLKDPSKAAA